MTHRTISICATTVTLVSLLSAIAGNTAATATATATVAPELGPGRGFPTSAP